MAPLDYKHRVGRAAFLWVAVWLKLHLALCQPTTLWSTLALPKLYKQRKHINKPLFTISGDGLNADQGTYFHWRQRTDIRFFFNEDSGSFHKFGIIGSIPYFQFCVWFNWLWMEENSTCLLVPIFQYQIILKIGGVGVCNLLSLPKLHSLNLFKLLVI